MSGSLSRRSAVVLALTLCLPCVGGCGYGSKVENGNIEVYYKDGATKAEAERLGAFLAKQWGAAGERRSVQIRKEGGKYQFRMVVKKGFENNPAVLADAPITAARLSHEVFDGTDVEFHLCDERLNTLKTLSMRDDMRFCASLNPIEVFHSPSVSRAEAEGFAREIKAEMGDPVAKVSFLLTRRGEVVEIRMPFDSSLLNDPATEMGQRQGLRRISANVFNGAPVELHLCDPALNLLKVVKP